MWGNSNPVFPEGVETSVHPVRASSPMQKNVRTVCWSKMWVPPRFQNANSRPNIYLNHQRYCSCRQNHSVVGERLHCSSLETDACA